MNRRIRIQRLAPQDRALWQKLYYRHQKPRLRRRLLALRALWDGQTIAEVCRDQKIDRKTVTRWLDAYLDGGFDLLLAPEHRQLPQALSPTRKRTLCYILLYKTPEDYGLASYQWTAPHVQELLEQKWAIHLKSGRIYQLFHEFGLSHQRVHRDYQPANPVQQAEFVADLKKNG